MSEEPIKEVKDASEIAKPMDTEAEEEELKDKEADTPKPISPGRLSDFRPLLVNPGSPIEWLRGSFE